MKDDVEIPTQVPHKRRVLEDQGVTLDRFIAVWLAGELTPSERKRLEAEKARRKALNPDRIVLGVLVGREGATPDQLKFIQARAREAGVEKVFAPAPMALGMRPGGFAVTSDLHEIVKASTAVVAAPKEPEKPNRVEGVWGAVRYAKHRRLPVRVVLPNGDERVTDA